MSLQQKSSFRLEAAFGLFSVVTHVALYPATDKEPDRGTEDRGKIGAHNSAGGAAVPADQGSGANGYQ